MASEEESRSAALAGRLTELGRRSEKLPGAPFVREVLENERRLGGPLLAGGVAFRMFLWLTPFGLVVAGLLSFWSDHDRTGLESAAKKFGVGAAAATAAARALEQGDRDVLLATAVGVVLLAWFTLGALRALVLAYALAWQVAPRRLRRPFRSILVFNGLFVLAFASSCGVTWLHEQIGTSALLGVAASLALMTGVGVLAMWLLPHGAARPVQLLPGALLVAVGYQLVQVAVLFYFAPRLGEAEETLGVFGAAATMLVWLYVLSRLVIGAAFLNATLFDHGAGRGSRAGAPS